MAKWIGGVEIDGHKVSWTKEWEWGCNCPAWLWHRKKYPVCAHAIMVMARMCYNLSDNITMQVANVPFVCVNPFTKDRATVILYPLVPVGGTARRLSSIVYDMLRAGATREMVKVYVKGFSDAPPEAYISHLLYHKYREYEYGTLPAWTHIPIIFEQTDGETKIFVHRGIDEEGMKFDMVRYVGGKEEIESVRWEENSIPDKVRQFIKGDASFWWDRLISHFWVGDLPPIE